MRPIEYKWLVGIAFVFGLFMDLLDMTIVNVALPAIQHDFHANVGSVAWLVTGYLLSLAIFIPVSGYLADRFGSKRIYVAALAMFTTASALCGLAPTELTLITCRMLQGIGGGMMVPVGTAMLFREFPPEERANASSVLAIPTVLAPMLGPVVGGLLVQSLGWRWIFWVNIPMGIAGCLFSIHVLREHREADPGRFDVAGFLLSGAGFASLLYGLSTAALPGQGLLSPRAWGCIALGLLLLGAMVAVELHHSHPMLDLRLFRDPNFVAGNLLGFVVFGGMMGSLFLYPLFLQNPLLKNLSPLESGLTTFPQAIGVMLLRPFTGRLLRGLGAKALIVGGTVFFALTSLVFTQIDITTSDWLIRGTLMVRGAGMALILTTVQTMTFYTVSGDEMGRASSIFNVMRQVAGSLGVALLATVLALRAAEYAGTAISAQRALIRGFDDAFWLASAFALVGVLVASILPISKHQPELMLAKPHPHVVLH